MADMVPMSLRSYLDEPAVPDPPARVWRDWVLIVLASVGAILEATLRTDAEWTSLPIGWRVGAVILFFVTLPPALSVRRTRPLLATLWAFVPTLVFSVTQAVVADVFGGLNTMAVVLVVPYGLYRWGSGRDGAIGVGILLGAWLVGSISDASVGASEWIGGFIVLSIPVQAGLIVRYRTSARERAILEATSREREDIARELHDTVAHHVSAIAVQAQAGRAIADADPRRALDVLAVIEEAASRTLEEMRTMVGTLRNGAEAELSPQGISDLARLARDVPNALRIDIEVDEDLGSVGPSVDSAVYRIAQESITNAVRHARHATHVRVRVETAGDAIRVTIVDDGQAATGATEQGFGLLGMAERAHRLGGWFVAGPTERRGWQVTAEMPRQAVPA